MWIWRRTEKISWLDNVVNKKVLRRLNEDRQILSSIWFGHVLSHNGLLYEFDIIEGRMRE